MVALLAVALAGVSVGTPVVDGAPAGLHAGTPGVLVITGADGAADVGVMVRLIHRAGLPGEFEEQAGLTDADGAVTVTPSAVGPVLVRAGTQSAVLTVAGPPPATAWGALLALLLAGAALAAPRRGA